MIFSSAIGSIGVYELLYDLISTEVHPNLRKLLQTMLIVLRFIADTGGGAVILGAIFIGLDLLRFGKWLVGIGLTFGSLALIIWIISTIVDITGIITDPEILSALDRLKGFFTYNTGMQFIGVTVAVIGRNAIKKPKKIKEEKLEEAEITKKEEELESLTPLPFQNINCPNCGASLPFNANFCSECGSSFEK
ncbi:MAG: zinc ribbon domain-containing protein [Promethearchaeota archaeon]